MAEYTLGSSKVLGNEFTEQAAAIFDRITNDDTLYLDRVQDAAVVSRILRQLEKSPRILPSAANPNSPQFDVNN